MSSEQASVDSCQLLRDNGRISSGKGDSDAVLSSSSEKTSRRRGLQIKVRKD